ncbi:universal stress protein [Salinibacterium sp.]|uniref:universal stress protein n=1 Tax=Salinibacterium sp. TaxID=1915057 RepID=UPI00286C9D45|nr:universal stress protein [Salinibacterium sp.]
MTIPTLPLVVGDDGSMGARRALEFTLDLAERLAAPVVVVRSWGIDPHTPAVAQILGYATSAADFTGQVLGELIRDTRETVNEHPGVDVEYRSGEESPAELLCEASIGSRMLVVGSRGLGGIAGLLLGSVSNTCLHESTRPVLVVHASHPRTRPTPDEEDPAHPGEIAIPRVTPGAIVVGHDGSPHADRALTEALGLAQELGVPVSVIRTWSIDSAPRGALWKDGSVSSHLEVSEAVRQELTAEIRPLTDSHPTVDVNCFAVLGQPANILTRASRDALMLVIGSRGLGGFGGLLLGSVSMQCAHRASCATLVVPHRG